MINSPISATFQQNAGQIFLNFRQAFQAVVNLNDYVTAIGGITALEAAPFSFDTTDSQAFVAALGNIANLEGATAAIADSQPFWGGY